MTKVETRKTLTQSSAMAGDNPVDRYLRQQYLVYAMSRSRRKEVTNAIRVNHLQTRLDVLSAKYREVPIDR